MHSGGDEMRDLILLAATAAMFVLGGFVMKQVDAFFAEQDLTGREKQNGGCRVRIAAETPLLLEAASPALAACSDANPYLEFCLSSGSEGCLLRELSQQSIDIALLEWAQIPQADERYGFVRVPCVGNPTGLTVCGLPVKPLERPESFYVVWNRNVRSKNRDRVLFALENEAGGLRSAAN